MKTIYKMLVAGMLATAPLASPATTISSTNSNFQFSISDALAQQIIGIAMVEMQGQSTQELSVELLFAAYQQGRLVIIDLGTNASGHVFQVKYEGWTGDILLEDL